MKNFRASAAPVAAPELPSQESWLLWRLGQVASRREPCPSLEALAAERDLSRSAIARLFEHLEKRGAIRSALSGRCRVVTIIATGTQTAALAESKCLFCGGMFSPRDKRAVYCSKACGRKAWHEKNPHVPADADAAEPSTFPPHSTAGLTETGVRPAPTIFEMPKAWRAYRYEDHPEAKRRYDERKARGYQPKIYPHHSNVARGDSPLGDFFL